MYWRVSGWKVWWKIGVDGMLAFVPPFSGYIYIYICTQLLYTSMCIVMVAVLRWWRWRTTRYPRFFQATLALGDCAFVGIYGDKESTGHGLLLLKAFPNFHVGALEYVHPQNPPPQKKLVVRNLNVCPDSSLWHNRDNSVLLGSCESKQGQGGKLGHSGMWKIPWIQFIFMRKQYHLIITRDQN